MVTIVLSHLLGQGVRLETHDAVALARSLMAHPGGIPTLENIQLGSDGSASCISTNGIPSVASVAELLLTLLPAGTPDVPAPLRYAIARGLEAVEAPPFKSLTEFSDTLARFEKSDSRDVLRGLLQRSIRPSRPSAAPIVAASTPVPPPAEAPSPAPPRSIVVEFPKRVVPTPAVASSDPPESIAPAPPIVTPTGGDQEAQPPAHSSRRWRLAVAAALVVSFTGGFALTHRIIDRRVANTPSRSAHVAPVPSGAPPAANDSAANPAEVERTDESVRPPRTPTVAREIPAQPPAARADGATDTQSRSVEHADEPVGTVKAVRAVDADGFSPAYTSDGTAIFFHTGSERDARSAIDVAKVGSQTDRDLGIMTIVDDGSHNYHAQPSPDGFSVAFDSDRDGERGVYVANRDGSHVRRVSGDGYAAVPTWSPNNEWLAYIRAEVDKPSVWNLWVQPAAGGSARRVTNYRYGETWAASWFPDNRRIAYSHEDTLMVMDLRTGEATRYQTPVNGRLVRTPAVSPDGTKIIFQAFRDGAWLLDLADGSMRRVLTDPTAEEFAWAPDGRRVAFHSRRDGHWGIYVVLPG
jgi:hypothetical protein